MGDLKKKVRKEPSEPVNLMIDVDTIDADAMMDRMRAYMEAFYEMQVKKAEQEEKEEDSNGEVSDIQERNNRMPL